MKLLCDTLKPVKVTAQRISEEKMDIVMADSAMSFCIDRLAAMPHELSKTLAENLVRRYTTRRNTNLIQLLAVLKSTPMYMSPARPIENRK